MRFFLPYQMPDTYRSTLCHRDAEQIILFPQTVASLPLVVNYKGQEYHATLTMPDGALLAGNNYTYTVKVRNKVLEVSEATIAKWNDIDGGDVDAGL